MMSELPFTQPSKTDAVPASSSDPDEQQQRALLHAFLSTVQHCFGGFSKLFQGVTDPRHPAFITYPLAALMTTGVLMFACRLAARRQIAHLLRHNGPVAAKFQALFGVETCPHGDTLNALFARVEPAQVQAVVTDMVATLIRQKVLSSARLLGPYYLIVMDGTGVLVFSERHCPHCLTRTHHGQTLYYHPVLEAKLVTANGFVFSLMTEFIENPGEHPVGGARHLGVHLVGRDLEQRLVGGNDVTLRLQPARDRALGDGHAHLGHHHFGCGSCGHRSSGD